MSVRLTISVPDIEVVLATFSSIRVKKSVTGVMGTYYNITADSPAVASMLAPNEMSSSTTSLCLLCTAQ